MTEIQLIRGRVFRETPGVSFKAIHVEGQNAMDLVEHSGPAVSPPDNDSGEKCFYIHFHQIDNNRVLGGSRSYELVNKNWKQPYHIVYLDKTEGALHIPVNTYHRSVSGTEGSLLVNHAIRDDVFDASTEFVPVSTSEDLELGRILREVTPVVHDNRK
ncbi:MAG: hypothetical protein KVP17_004612 [Porospora cf. gigantea B]|uniref:uncharacterized protein n=1 Tax=Porospora cf. gigantea B TaxID=2853592 RepID=UPI003571C99B|nr:MAG: hypothetical protein KVP17_004612 [Porospora cf. gigantea B]